MHITQKPGEPICGLQFEGTAREVTDAAEIETLLKPYEARFNRAGLAKEIIEGANPHHVYQLTPSRYALFDKAHFPELDSAQEWRPNA